MLFNLIQLIGLDLTIGFGIWSTRVGPYAKDLEHEVRPVKLKYFLISDFRFFQSKKVPNTLP